MQKITPFLWFDSQAEEAANFYASVFKDAEIGEISRYQEGGPGTPGQAMVVPFTLFGQKYLALNGGPVFEFNPAVSFVVNCESQEEVDQYWDALTDGGMESECGWLKDKFGLSWQIVPTVLAGLLGSSDAEAAKRVMTAMLQMKKLDIGVLQTAARS